MRTAASIFSWLGGIINVIDAWIGAIVFMYISPLLLIAAIIYTVIVIVILIWRQAAVETGNKIGCGICTLLFVSLLGGILTLSIPDETYEYSPSSYDYSQRYISSNSQITDKPLTEYEKIELINKYKKLLDDGVITEEEFQQKKNDLL